MAGLNRLCKLYGGLTAKGADGKEVRYVYDYAADKAVLDTEMPFGSARHAASERAKYLQHPPRNALQCAARACPGCAVCSKPPNDRLTRPRASAGRG